MAAAVTLAPTSVMKSCIAKRTNGMCCISVKTINAVTCSII